MCNTSSRTVRIRVERDGKVGGVGKDPLQSVGLLHPKPESAPWKDRMIMDAPARTKSMCFDHPNGYHQPPKDYAR